MLRASFKQTWTKHVQTKIKKTTKSLNWRILIKFFNLLTRKLIMLTSKSLCFTDHTQSSSIELTLTDCVIESNKDQG